MSKAILVLNVADNASAEDIATDINAEILCRLEEDDKTITGWEWIY